MMEICDNCIFNLSPALSTGEGALARLSPPHSPPEGGSSLPMGEGWGGASSRLSPVERGRVINQIFVFSSFIVVVGKIS